MTPSTGRSARNAALIERADRARLEVTGPDAAGFLQSQVTNETEELAAGSGVYAALLDRKGHLQAEMRILRLDGERFLIDTEATTGPALLKHFSMYKIGRKVEVGETDRALFSLIGPAAVEVTGLTPGSENDFTETVIAGAGCLVVVTALGLDVICDPGSSDAVRAQLEADRAVPVSAEAAEILRVERAGPASGST